MPNIAYPNQHIDIEIPHGSRDHVIVPDTVKITFNLDIESTDIDAINNSDIYDTYKELYLSEKQREERLLQGIQPDNGLKAQLGAKKADGTALTLTTQENAIKKTFDKRFAIPLYFDFFRHPVYAYGLKEDLIVGLELNSPEKVILCKGDTSATYKLSNISLEYHAIFDESYVTTISKMYTETSGTSIPYTKVTWVHYQALSKKDTTWKIDVNNISFRSLQGLLFLFLTNVMTLPTRMKNFTTQASRKFW